MFLIVLFVLVAIIILTDLFLWQVFIKRKGSVFVKILYWLPTSLILLSIGVSGIGYFKFWLFELIFFVLAVIAFPKLLFAIVVLFTRIIPLKKIRLIIDRVALFIALAISISFIYGFTLGWKNLVVNEVNVTIKNLPKEFNGYRIVQISDLHLGSFGENISFIQRLVKEVNSLNADIIFFTGDLINILPDEIAPFKNILSELNAGDGVYSILGNHDYCIYNRYSDSSMVKKDLQRVKDAQEDMGWHLLLNEQVPIIKGGDTLMITGLEDHTSNSFTHISPVAAYAFGNLNKETGGNNRVDVLLVHNPNFWQLELSNNNPADLTLSGHTHAMQFKIGNWSPASFIYKRWGGLYEENGKYLHVSVGAGGSLPFRLGAWPEITVITLN